MLPFKYKAFLHLKNSVGWSTKRKIVVFSVDDYGNIRIASSQAKANLQKAGLKLDRNRFDQFDALETSADLMQLFEALSSVKDKNGKSAAFTAFALPANIDFARMKQTGYQKYYYKMLPEVLNDTQGHEGTWNLWQQGMRERLLVPQFHGREHVNVSFLTKSLAVQNPNVLACLEEQSWAGLDIVVFPNINYVSAFSFDSFDENIELGEIARDGLQAFENVFGFKAKNFNAPGAPAHRSLENSLAASGVRYIDTPFIKSEHQGKGKYKYRFALQGMKNAAGQRYLIRNCVFEPLLDRKVGPAERTLLEMEIAFRHNKPAIISSHRVNFCGKVAPEVRAFGLEELRKLLGLIMKRWPDVEFMTADELGDEISKSK